MAISVKQFLNPLNCDEPDYEIQVMYDPNAANGGSNICNGGGTLTNVYGDFSTLADIFSNSSTANAAIGDICDEGMDVVFVVDYTSSMNNAISGVKTGIANIASEINTQTAGNYRLGLVVYDEYQAVGNYSNIFYASSQFYQNLPSSQKLIETNTPDNRKQVYTCVEKMTSVGNIGGPSTGFTQGLNALDQSNSSTGMALGNGAGGPEPGGLATYKAAADNFAGQWRSGVLKLIIHITDNYPGGNDDAYSSADVTYFQNTLTPALDNNNIQFFHNSDTTAASNENANTYKYLVENTTPAGLGNYSVNYSNSNWINGIITGIQDLCDTTTTYTCDPAAAGWYAETPIVGGTTIAYYWDGTAWTSQYSCPAPEFTVTVDFVDSVSNGSVDDFQLSHPNYLDVDTLTFTGVEGAVFSATADVSVNSGYQNMSLTVSNISDTNVITNTSVDNTQLEVTAQVTIGNTNSSESLQINGTATIIPRKLRVDVINGTTDNLDSQGDFQTPAGYINMTLVEPPAANWVNMAASYNTFAHRYEFEDAPGVQYNFDIGFIPSPNDYFLNISGQTIHSTTLTGQGGNSFQAGLDAINGLTLTTGSSSPDLEGYITIPAVDCWVKIFITGDVNQPRYFYRLNASDLITGATATPASQSFEGYTGETFPFTVAATADLGYTNVNVNTVGLDLTQSDNAAITTGPTVNSNNDGAEGIITMPQGGGVGGVVLGGSATQAQYQYTVTIIDNFNTASWSQVIFNGPAENGVLTQNNATAIGNPEYSYNAQTISNNSAGSILTSTIASASTPSINLSLSGMPLGGGSATVTINGTETQIEYDFALNIVTDIVTNGSFATPSVILTGVANAVITGTFTYTQASGYTYLSTGHSTSSPAIDPITYVVGQLLSTDYTVTMPSGGGSGTITCDDVEENVINYSYDLGFDTDASSTFDTNATITPSAPITLTGPAGTQINWTYTVTPSPSYYEFYNFVTSQIETYSGSSNPNPGGNLSNTGTEISIGAIGNAPGGGGAKNIYGSVTMPNGGGEGSIMPTPKTYLQLPTEDFQINIVNNISNTTFTPSTPHSIAAQVGSAISRTIDMTANSGYTHDVTSVTVSNSHNGTVSASATISEDVLFQGTMPVGGGATTVTINGNSTPIILSADFNFTEKGGGDAESEGDWDNATVQFSGAPGSTHNISEFWRTTNNGNNQQFGPNSQTDLTVTGTNWPSQDPFNGTLYTSEPTNGNDSRTTATFTMPSAGGTWNLEFNSTRFVPTTTLAPCNCNNYEVGNGGTPPLVGKSNESNGNSSGHFELSFIQACGSILSAYGVQVNYGLGFQAYLPGPSTNNTTFKRWTGLSAATYRVTLQYDAGDCIGETDVIDIVIQNIITTTTTTSGGYNPGPRGMQ